MFYNYWSQDEDPGDCIYCVDEITAAVEQCPNETTIECVEDALGATSTCLDCVCDVLNIIEGGDGDCGGDVPTDAPTTAGPTTVGPTGTVLNKYHVDMIDDRDIARVRLARCFKNRS